MDIASDLVAKGVCEHSNEIGKYRDTNVNLGGPIRKDKVWWYFSYRDQKTSVQQANFIGAIAGTNNKLIGYYQWGQKIQPTRMPSSSYLCGDLASTTKQDSGSWVYKGEWNSTLSQSTYAEARYGVFGYYFPQMANTDTTLPEIINNQVSQYFNGDQKEQTDRHRGQLTGALTYFKDGLAGTHNIKIGGEMLMENQYVGYLQVASGNLRETIGSNGVPTTIQIYAPTAIGGILSGPHGDLLSVANLVDPGGPTGRRSVHPEDWIRAGVDPRPFSFCSRQPPGTTYTSRIPIRR